MWLNVVLNPSTPLAENLIDNDIDYAEVYGMDPRELPPFENSVVTPELNLNRDIRIIWQFLSERFDLLAPQIRIGISIMVKEHVSELLLGEWIQAGGKRKLYFLNVFKELENIQCCFQIKTKHYI